MPCSAGYHYNDKGACIKKCTNKQYRDSSGRCQLGDKVCQETYEISPTSNRCIKGCNPNQFLNKETGRCKIYKGDEPVIERQCPEGKELYEGRCLKKCNPGQKRHPETKRCRKELIAPQFEGVLADDAFFQDVPTPLDGKIAFCFLLRDTVKHKTIWKDFFDNGNPEAYSIVSHVKKVTPDTPKWIKENMIPTIPTKWCEDSLVWAWVNMLREAVKDPQNQYFALLSGECIPLQNFTRTYIGITSDSRSRFNIDFNSEQEEETGLKYADQWCILNRRDALLLISLKHGENGKKHLQKMKRVKRSWCSDELYPINWMIHNYGDPNTKKFRNHIKLQQTTFTKWDNVAPHPIVITKSKLSSLKRQICNSGAFFARKFDTQAAIDIYKEC